MSLIGNLSFNHNYIIQQKMKTEQKF